MWQACIRNILMALRKPFFCQMLLRYIKEKKERYADILSLCMKF